MGSGSGAGRGSLESLRRAGRTLFFLVNMLVSLSVSCGPLLVSIVDICVVYSAFTCCTACFSFRADWATYSFRCSLVDIPLLSLGRSLLALCKYCSRHLYLQALSSWVFVIHLFRSFVMVMVEFYCRCLCILRNSEPLLWPLLGCHSCLWDRH